MRKLLALAAIALVASCGQQAGPVTPTGNQFVSDNGMSMEVVTAPNGCKFILARDNVNDAIDLERYDNPDGTQVCVTPNQ